MAATEKHMNTLTDSEAAQIRTDFPALQQTVNGKPLVYLDNSASTHKPMVVIDRIREFYTKEYSKIQSGHTLGKHATEAFEEARAKVAAQIHARDPKEIVFLRGCTEAINVVAAAFLRGLLKPGDEILLTQVEHHSNIIP